MKTLKSNIARNLTTLRQLNKYSQEDVAEQIGVSRQAVAKWESGESVPDIVNCDALAQLYNVELNDLFRLKASTYSAQSVWASADRSYFPNKPEKCSESSLEISWSFWGTNLWNIQALP